MNGDKVVELCSARPGFAVADGSDLWSWARGWIDGLADGDYGEVRSLVLVVESADGRVATISQSLTRMDAVRLVGLLHHVAHRKSDGRANIEELRDGT